MVFSSLPVYLDPSSHWQQQPNDGQAGVGINDRNPEHTQAAAGAGGGGKGLIRPGSMTERARLAKLPMPEAGLRCPRCESTNTKFCYFNNYSLSQPRHFCKTCRRYWTRGGAMRNVPVGGGFRRNKRRKGSGSKSPSTSKRQTASASASASTGGPPSLSCTTDILAHFPPPPQLLPFLPSHLHHLADYCAGLNFGGVQAEVAGTGGGSVSVDTDFQIGGGSRGGGAVDSGGFADDQWRLQQVQQFPFLGAAGTIDAPGVIYQFEGDQGVSPQLASVKLEDNQRLNLSRNFLGVPGNDQYWVGNAWTDHLSGFASSSTTHLL